MCGSSPASFPIDFRRKHTIHKKKIEIGHEFEGKKVTVIYAWRTYAAYLLRFFERQLEQLFPSKNRHRRIIELQEIVGFLPTTETWPKMRHRTSNEKNMKNFLKMFSKLSSLVFLFFLFNFSNMSLCCLDNENEIVCKMK